MPPLFEIEILKKMLPRTMNFLLKFVLILDSVDFPVGQNYNFLFYASL